MPPESDERSHNHPFSETPRSPTAELWGDEPDELLFYEAEGDDAENYEDSGSQQGENNQQSIYDEADEYPQGEDDDPEAAYEEAVADEAEEPSVLNLHAAPSAAPTKTSPLRSWSSHSSKRSFDDDGIENSDRKGQKYLFLVMCFADLLTILSACS